MEDVKMYLLIVCALSWLVLLGSLITAWTGLPQPRTATDIVVIVVIAAATAVFARLGLVSIIALLLRTLPDGRVRRSEEHTSELQSRFDLVCRLLLEKK